MQHRCCRTCRRPRDAGLLHAIARRSACWRTHAASSRPPSAARRTTPRSWAACARGGTRWHACWLSTLSCCPALTPRGAADRAGQRGEVPQPREARPHGALRRMLARFSCSGALTRAAARTGAERVAGGQRAAAAEAAEGAGVNGAKEAPSSAPSNESGARTLRVPRTAEAVARARCASEPRTAADSAWQCCRRASARFVLSSCWPGSATAKPRARAAAVATRCACVGWAAQPHSRTSLLWRVAAAPFGCLAVPLAPALEAPSHQWCAE